MSVTVTEEEVHETTSKTHLMKIHNDCFPQYRNRTKLWMTTVFWITLTLIIFQTLAQEPSQRLERKT